MSSTSKGLVPEFLSEKQDGFASKGIPAPATTPVQPSTRTNTWKRRFYLICSTLFALVLFHKAAHYAGYTAFGSKTQGAELLPPEWVGRLVQLHGQQHSGHHSHGKHHKHKGPHHGGRRPHSGHQVPFGKAAEKLFLSVPNNESAVEASRLFTKTPHMAGTPEDLTTAKDFLAILQKELNISVPDKEPIFPAGSENSQSATLSIPEQRHPSAWIDIYYPALNTPLNRSIEILDEDGKPVWQADLEEKAEMGEGDDAAAKYADAVPAFHGLSRDGEAQGKLVYAKYGRKEDYDALEEAGISLNGTIAIVKYGGIFRGLKVKGAQERGALACLVFSDPHDDGSVTTENGYKPYPDGPARNFDSVQRGSVQFLSIYPGDPTTPGYPAYENSTRTEGSNIPSIPSIPISWNNAKRLLKEIEEGGKDRIVKVVNHVEGKTTPIWNVMGVIPGHIRDEIVLVGNHRDAWVMGGADPSSGTASFVETIRGLGALLSKGWRPLRTIVLASWDAEEYGLIGSTEWGEDFQEWIDKYVVAYLNLDSSVSGSRFSVAASPSLAHMMRETAEDVPHPTIKGRTLWQARFDSGTLSGPVDPEIQQMYDEEFGEYLNGPEIFENGSPVHSEYVGVSPLGSGSDYTIFLDRIGVASSQHGFGATLSDPVYHYHSVFDSQAWQEKYGDPGFHRHVAIAQHLGLQILRVADALVLPLNTTQYAFELDAYLNKVESIALSQHMAADFTALRSSITKVQAASLLLDAEKAAAEKALRRLIHIIHKQASRRRWLKRQWWKFKKTVCKFIKCKTVPGEGARCTAHIDTSRLEKVGFGGEIRQALRLQGDTREPIPSVPFRSHHGIPPKLIKKLIQAAKRVRAANKKLVAFERGFISKEGIKDREWYKHLGVGPGKWLGYGATTFPGLTEALIYEKNMTLVQYEAERLEKLFDALGKEIAL